MKLRRRAWHGHEIPLEDEGPMALPDVRQSPAADVESNELLSAIARAIETQLTPHQRHVLVSITVHGVPIDVLAERLSTTRGALYKTLHDARRKLRAHLTELGMTIGGEG